MMAAVWRCLWLVDRKKSRKGWDLNGVAVGEEVVFSKRSIRDYTAKSVQIM